MHYGSQEDIVFLNTINSKRGYFDIIIDDGGHTMNQQITSFTHLFIGGGTYRLKRLEPYLNSAPFGSASPELRF
jgi:hypothetical protein